MNRWSNDDNFEKDLEAISDFVNASTSEQSFPDLIPSNSMMKARSKRSLYEDNFDKEDFVEGKCKSGRGHPLLWADEIKPGGTPAFLQEEMKTLQEIREVSNIGYSNEQIEKLLKSKLVEDCDTPKTIPDIRLQRPTSSSHLPSIRKSTNKQKLETNTKVSKSIYDILKEHKDKENDS